MAGSAAALASCIMALLTGAFLPCARHCSTLRPPGPSSGPGMGMVRSWLESELPLLEACGAALVLRRELRGWYSSSSELLTSTSAELAKHQHCLLSFIVWWVQSVFRYQVLA